MRKILNCFVFASAAFILTGADYLGDAVLHKSRLIQDQTCDVTIFDADLKGTALSLKVDQALDQMELTIQEVSETTTQDMFSLDTPTGELLLAVFNAAQATEGAIDPTAGELATVWRKAQREMQPPDLAAIESALPKAGYRDILVDHEARSIRLSKGIRRLNLANYAGAFAADQAVDFLKKAGVRSGFVSAGEGIRFIGSSNSIKDWRVGIEHPADVNAYAATLELAEARAISTSSDYEDFFIFKGKRFASIVDPRNGYPPQNEVRSVSVIANDLLTAKLYSDAFFVLGPDKSYEIADGSQESLLQVVTVEEKPGPKWTLSGSEMVHQIVKDVNL